MNQFINPHTKLFQHMDRLQQIKLGSHPPPVNVEIDLSNRCSHGCSFCLTQSATLDILGRGKCSIADVRPGDCVLACNQDTGKTQWAEVYAVSKRNASESIYRITVGDKTIEATGNHEVFTRRGWVDARHLTIHDEVANVSETMRALRDSQSRMSCGDDARTSPQMDGTATAEFDSCDSCISENWQKFDLEFQRIISISPFDMAVEVFNLETSTATYFANDLLVHNCHFAYTHTRGPLAGKRDKPSGAVLGGDLMDVGLAVSLIRQLKEAGVKSVVWTGGGEPTLHPNFDEIASLAASRGLEQGMYTHGGHIDVERAMLIKEKFTWVYVSLDECTAESFHAIKGVNRFDAVIKGIKRLVAAEGAATVGIGFLLHPENAHSIYDMVRLGRELGVDYVQFRPVIHFNQDTPNKLTENTDWIERAIGRLNAYRGDPFVVADVSRFRMYQHWQGHGYKTCNWSALQTVITPNGKIWRCTNKREHADALLGDLAVDTFADIWARSGGSCAVDAHCRVMCRGHIANVTLDELFSPTSHPNFI